MNLVLPHLVYLAMLEPGFEKTGEVIRRVKHSVAMRRRIREKDVKACQSNLPTTVSLELHHAMMLKCLPESHFATQCQL
jgi:hypothetical protein